MPSGRKLKMIEYYSGTVFNVDAQALVNTVNCVGVMGAGIALEFQLRYPKMYQDYTVKCKNKLIKTGHVDYFKNDDGITIINFPTKWHFKYPSQLSWIEQGLQNFVETYKRHDIQSVAFPKLGTNKGGLNWEQVRLVMEKYLGNLDIKIYICLDNLKDAEGIEKKMLDRFNSTNTMQLNDVVKLSEKQKVNIDKGKPYKRFWHIRESESIGIKTYSTLFTYYYDICQGRDILQQPALFE